MMLRRNQTHYVIPKGECLPYISFVEIAKKGLDGAYSDNPIIRHASVANKWKTIHLIMHSGMNATIVHFNLTFQSKDDEEFKMQITLEVDTREEPKINITSTQAVEDNMKATTSVPEAEMIFEDVPEEDRFPRIKKHPNGTTEAVVEDVAIQRVNLSVLPEDVKLALQNLDLQLEVGDVTQKGYNLSKAALLRPFQMLPAATKAAINNLQDAARKEVHDSLRERENTTIWHKPSQNGGDSKMEEQMDEAFPLEFVPIGSTLVAMKVNNDFPLEHSFTIKSESTSVIQNTAKNHDSREGILNTFMLKEAQKLKEIKKTEEEKKGDVEDNPAHAKEHIPGSQVLRRRKLQYYTGNYQGFLPWEKHKYFQDLLDVSITNN